MIAHLHHALGQASVIRERRLGAVLDVKLAVGSRGFEPFKRVVGLQLQQADCAAGRGECEEGLGHFEGDGEGGYLRLRFCELSVHVCVRQWLETFRVATSMVQYTGVCLEASVLGKTAKLD
jgi:hypothetical protein